MDIYDFLRKAETPEAEEPKAEADLDAMIDVRCARNMRKVAKCSQCLRYRECLALGESSVFRSRRKRGLT